MRARVHYRSVAADSERFDDFVFRDGDIIISTPPKCGTTWTQTICALLIFQTPKFPRALDIISPWLDQTLRTKESVLTDLEAQQHRRFVKTHTPFDGLPYEDRATYICVARDPRDVAVSWDNHFFNLDIAALLTLREKAVGLDDLADFYPDGLPVPAASEIERFWQWVDEPGPVTQTPTGLASTLNHLSTFFEAKSLPNVVVLHYDDLKADLDGEMRKLADRLKIAVPPDRWEGLVRAATFEEMKKRAAEVSPNATETIWLDTNRFFNRGTSGQWRNLLDEEGLRRYAARVAELADDDLSNWVHRGPIIP